MEPTKAARTPVPSSSFDRSRCSSGRAGHRPLPATGSKRPTRTKGPRGVSVPYAGAADVDATGDAADAALDGPWGAMSAIARGKLVGRLSELVAVHADELAAVESTDNGKLLRETTGQPRALPTGTTTSAVSSARSRIRPTDTSSNPPSSPVSATACASRRNRPSGRCLRPCRSMTRARRSRNANETRYGLGAGIWADNLRRAPRVAHQLRAGTVWVSCYRTLSYNVSCGGYKQRDRPGERHRPIPEYTETKAVSTNMSEQTRDTFVLRSDTQVNRTNPTARSYGR